MSKVAIFRWILFLFLVINCNSYLYAEQNFNNQSSRRILSIVEPGELADTVSIWGDIQQVGRYAIPRESSVIDVLQYGRGVRTLRDQQIVVGLSRIRVEVSIFRGENRQREQYANKFVFYYDRPLPSVLTSYRIKNKDIIYVSVKKEPSLLDLIQIIAPILSGIATIIALANGL